MKKMDVNTLMTGDWVATPKGNRKIEELSVKCNLANWNDYGCTFDEIKPIPITKEFLEKNGFVKLDENGTYKWFLPDEQEYYYGYSSIYYSIEEKLLNVVRENRKGAQNQCKGNFEYVHELQHALKLCGIEKEFVL